MKSVYISDERVGLLLQVAELNSYITFGIPEQEEFNRFREIVMPQIGKIINIPVLIGHEHFILQAESKGITWDEDDQVITLYKFNITIDK